MIYNFTRKQTEQHSNFIHNAYRADCITQLYKSYILSVSPGHPLGTGARLRPANNQTHYLNYLFEGNVGVVSVGVGVV